MKSLYLGNQSIHFNAGNVTGQQVVLAGEDFYCIANSDRLRPFFISLVSSSDLWMFLSSNGALTAGRQNPDQAVFPYYTDDKIHDAAETTGPKSIFIVEQRGRHFLWEPFSVRGVGSYRTQRNLYKNFYGNKIIFEEINHDLNLSFRYRWTSSESFGWIRHATLANLGSQSVKIRLLDGLQNLLPSGISSQFQLEKSTLIDAYKRNELLPAGGLGLFRLSSIPVDRPEPSESLLTTTVWSAGLPRRNVLLSARQLDNFRRDLPLRPEADVRAERGAYFIEANLSLRPQQAQSWMMAADVKQSSARVADLQHWLRQPAKLQRRVETDIAAGTEELWQIVARADGLQKTARPLGDARHFGNVLFNVMRGGIFLAGYQVDTADLQAFVRQANVTVAARHAGFFRQCGRGVLRDRMLTLARRTGDPHLERLCLEYLPLTFSRRHGDPSRPWNRFSIASRDAAGRRVLNYEGNWRDIFQNWEALAVSFPGFVSGMICKFVNASTADGYNPYRVTRDGLDWEVPDPHDPWAHIGYWGDHQIIYLLKLLEILEQHEPTVLRDFLTRKIFSFANVPYRIKPFAQLLENPRETVDFDKALDQLTQQRVRKVGADGKLLWNKRDQVCLVNLTEKLLVPLLAKFANFIPGAGIWLNTQRPEWNDANNALVGNGVSMVTLYQLRRHLSFCRQLLLSAAAKEISLSVEVAQWLRQTTRILEDHHRQSIGDAERHEVLTALGKAAETYRQKIYARGFSGQCVEVKRSDLLEFFSVALVMTDASIRDNQRQDGLYHAYNLIAWRGRRGIAVQHLSEMLEGQTAMLSANFLSAEESLAVLSALRQSSLYRPDQHSYLLYPNRRLAGFIEKNHLPRRFVARSPLLKKLLADGNRQLIEPDAHGVCHFQPAITNAGVLRNLLHELAGTGYARLVKRESAAILDLYEQMFDHRSFTGRSGTFFGYEGLGCIYWHMVSKLLLAAQEAFVRGCHTPFARKLAERYYDLRAGIGDFKTPENYGAFPMDPYSHTPGHTGARQPGLTGQVKEDILSRWGELGISVTNGQIGFQPQLLRREEFLTAPAEFHWFDLSGTKRRIRLPAHSLAFTCWQTLVVYRLGAKTVLTVHFADGSKAKMSGHQLTAEASHSLFARTGQIRRIEFIFPETTLVTG